MQLLLAEKNMRRLLEKKILRRLKSRVDLISQLRKHDKNVLFLSARHGIGDHLMGTAVIEGIKKNYPHLRIVIFASRPEIFENNPFVDKCYSRKLLKGYNHNDFVQIVGLNHKAGYTTELQAGCKSQHFIDIIYDNLPLSVIDRICRPSIYLSKNELNVAKKKVSKLKHPFVAIAAFGKKKSRNENKIYPLEQWKEVIELLRFKGLEVIQIGNKRDPLLKGVKDFRKLKLRESAAVLSYCDAVITYVGGIMHLATAVRTICVALYAGVEDPEVSGYSENCNLISNIDCAPCWRKQLCKNRKCMKLLSPEIVVRETVKVVSYVKNSHFFC